MFLAALALASFLLALALAGCNTYQAIVETPPDFWMQLETILLAVWQDVADLVDLLL